MSGSHIDCAGRYAGFDIAILGNGVAIVTLDRAEKLNGLTAAMKRDLIEALFQLQIAPGVRAIIFTGAGRAFCSGDDFISYYERGRSMEARAPEVGPRRSDPGSLPSRLRLISQQLNTAVRDCELITIAAINGTCIQSGLSLALACDFRIAAADASIGSATLRFGFQPDENGHFLLVQHIGVARTLEFLLRRKIVTGAQALDLGLVHEVHETQAVLPRALELAGEFAEGPQTAMRLLKRAIYNAADMTFAQAAEDIAVRTAISDHHPDTEEGVRAFREKRKPRFGDRG